MKTKILVVDDEPSHRQMLEVVLSAEGYEIHQAGDGQEARVTIAPEGSAAANYAFDVTPARLVTGLITERGRCAASKEGLLGLYPERVSG